MESTDVLTDDQEIHESSESEFVFPPPAPGETPNLAIHDLSGMDPEAYRKLLIEALEEGVRQVRNGECVPYDFDEIMAELDAES